MKGTFTPTVRVKVPFMTAVFEITPPSSNPIGASPHGPPGLRGARTRSPPGVKRAVNPNLPGECPLHAEREGGSRRRRGGGGGPAAPVGFEDVEHCRFGQPNPVWCKEIVS